MSGGAAVLATDIVNTLAKMGHKITVITPDIQWDGPRYEPELGDKVETVRVKVPSENKIKVAARRCKKPMINKAVEIGSERNFDFVFSIFHPFHFAPRAAVETADRLNIPSIIKIDDAVYEKSSGLKSLQRRIEKSVNSKTLRNASYLLVMNPETKRIVINEYNVDKKKISIVPNGINLELFQNKEKTGKKIVLFSGAMYNHRGIDVLLKTVKKVSEKIPDVRYELFGDGPEREKLEEYVKDEKLEEYVFFKGWIKREELPNRLKHASIGIGPLKATTVTHDALPIKVLEYMASGLPIIAQRGTLPDQVLKDGENGFFVDDAEELAEKIILLLSDDTLGKKMSAKSADMVKKFSCKRVAQDILDIMKSQ